MAFDRHSYGPQLDTLPISRPDVPAAHSDRRCSPCLALRDPPIPTLERSPTLFRSLPPSPHPRRSIHLLIRPLRHLGTATSWLFSYRTLPFQTQPLRPSCALLLRPAVVRPVWEICVRYLRVPRRFAYYTAWESVLAFSMLYELVEWGLSMALAGPDADAYNGQQGDMWDAQKDMFFALLGATLALVILFLTRRRRAATGVPPDRPEELR
jgi:Predicted membrane protein (DUF2238)